jgi:hypothetical protein
MGLCDAGNGKRVLDERAEQVAEERAAKVVCY